MGPDYLSKVQGPTYRGRFTLGGAQQKNYAKFASWEMGGTMYFWHLQEYKSFILYDLNHYDGFHAEMQLNANAFGKMLLKIIRQS